MAIHEYTLEESSHDVRTWTVTSEKKLTEQELNMIAEDAHMQTHSIEVIRDDDNIIQVKNQYIKHIGLSSTKRNLNKIRN